MTDHVRWNYLVKGKCEVNGAVCCELTHRADFFCNFIPWRRNASLQSPFQEHKKFPVLVLAQRVCSRSVLILKYLDALPRLCFFKYSISVAHRSVASTFLA
jgi:hypothetical protein